MKELAAVEKCPYSLDELNSMIRDVDERSEDIREAIEQYHHQLVFEPKFCKASVSLPFLPKVIEEPSEAKN